MGREPDVIEPTAPRMRWWRVFGPWQIRPALLTIVTFMYYLTFQAGAIGNNLLLTPSAFFPIWLPGLISCAVFYAICRGGHEWQRRFGVHWPSYIVTLLALTAMAVFFRQIHLIPNEIVGPVPTVVSAVRLLTTFMVTCTVAGLVVDRLERQIVATNEALRLAREQQIQIITADEEARRQVALLLHDRVQAGLLATCLEMKSLSRAVPPETQAALEALTHRLETIRSIDVRQAAHVLSPNLEDIDLTTAIEDLATQYEASFSVYVHVDAAIERELMEDGTFMALAIYRIVDQALLNVAAHSGATEVVVRVDSRDAGYRVTVEDNGRGLPQTMARGLGSTIITTWVRATDGRWELLPNRRGPGTVLVAELGADKTGVAPTS